jgi:hypothetical protein
MGKLHELLAVEETVVAAAEKLIAETNEKFNKHTEFFTGGIRTLSRLKDSPEDRAIEVAQRRVKELPTDVPSTLQYIFPYIEKALDLKLSKHLTNQKAVGNIELEGNVVAADVPVDFLLDLEKAIPRWRKMYEAMPTLDPSRKWETERAGVWKSEAPKTAQTEKIMYPVELSPATIQHPAQVKEATKDIVVGTFNQTDISGAATTQQKADVLALCDRLLVAVKQARMRANATEQVQGSAAKQITNLFSKVFE